jgi:hypothetical protein
MPTFKSPRLKFPPGEQRKYIEQIVIKNDIRISEIALIAGVSPRTIREWKREKYNITKKAINNIKGSLKSPKLKNINKLIKKWQIMRSRLNRLGGIARYRKYGNFATIEGCRKGGSKALKILRSKGIIPECKHFSLPKKLSTELAEFVGILLGDGGITKEQVTITLNSKADKQYVKYVNNLGIKLFNDKPTIAKRKDCNANTVCFSGKQLVEYLVKNGLKIGDKVRQQVGVPNWIQNSKSYTKMCLRGLMDTDGGVVISTHKYKSKLYKYLNFCFTNKSKPLLNFVTNSLIKFGLHPCVAGIHVWLYNMTEFQAYFRIIGSSNYRLLKFKEDDPDGKGTIR